MTTVINTPPANNGDASGFGFVVGVLFVIVVIGLFVLFGLPYVKNTNEGGSGGWPTVVPPGPGTGNPASRRRR